MSFASGVQLTGCLPWDKISAEIPRLSSGLHRPLKSVLWVKPLKYVALMIHFNQTHNEPAKEMKITFETKAGNANVIFSSALNSAHMW